MIRALIGKELRALRPWAVLSLCIGLIDVADELFMHQPDMRPLSTTWDNLGEATGIVMWVVAYAIGTGLVVREQDDRTLLFLDGLPVSRTTVFSVKCLLTCALLAIAPCITLIDVIVEHALSHGALDSQLRLVVLLELFGLQLAVIIHGVFVGAAMGMLRSLTWLATAVIATTLSLLVEQYPRSALLNPLSMLKVQITNAGVIVDGETLRAQLGIALIAALIAWIGFLRSGRPSVLADLNKRPVVGALITSVTVVALITALTISQQHAAATKREASAKTSDAAAAGAHFADSAPAQTTTRHYRFSYAATQAKQVLALAAQADEIFERVHALLEVPLGDSIDVDASGSARNTAGTAYFDRVRIVLDQRAAGVLAHETTHVIAQRLSGHERSRLWSSARVLDEGLAWYVQQRFEGDHDAARSDRLVLAALYTRHQLLVAEIADADLLASMRDDDLKYPIGAAVIAAMVRLYGPQSISRLVSAFANDHLPADLRGLTLIETASRGADMDFAAVIAELFKQAGEDARLHAAELAAFPRPRVRLVRRADAVGAQVLCDPPSDASHPRLWLRFKPREDSPLDRYDAQIAHDDRPVWRSRSQVQHGEICVQPGLQIGPGQILYEPWTCLPIRDAATWYE